MKLYCLQSQLLHEIFQMEVKVFWTDVYKQAI